MSSVPTPRLVKRQTGKLTCLRCGKRLTAPPSKRGADALINPVELYGIECPGKACRQVHLAVVQWPARSEMGVASEIDALRIRHGYPDSVLLITALSSEVAEALKAGPQGIEQRLHRLGVQAPGLWAV